MTEEDRFVFGLHPHGVLSDYRILLDGVTREHFPKVQCLLLLWYITMPQRNMHVGEVCGR